MKKKYVEEVAPALMTKFQYESVMQIPKIEKIVVSVGCGDCKAACNETNHLPPGISRLLMERQSKSHRVIGKEPCPICGKLEECDCERKYVRVSCQQCQDCLLYTSPSPRDCS